MSNTSILDWAFAFGLHATKPYHRPWCLVVSQCDAKDRVRVAGSVALSQQAFASVERWKMVPWTIKNGRHNRLGTEVWLPQFGQTRKVGLERPWQWRTHCGEPELAESKENCTSKLTPLRSRPIILIHTVNWRSHVQPGGICTSRSKSWRWESHVKAPKKVSRCRSDLTSPCSNRFLLNTPRLQHLWPRCVVFARMKPDDKINARTLESSNSHDVTVLCRITCPAPFAKLFRLSSTCKDVA